MLVPYVGHSSRHTSREVTPCLSQHHDASAGHVLAAVVAGSFHHGNGSGVSDTKSFTHLSIDVQLSGSGAVESGVAGDDVVFCCEITTYRWKYGDASATQAFGEVVVGVAFQFEADAV